MPKQLKDMTGKTSGYATALECVNNTNDRDTRKYRILKNCCGEEDIVTHRTLVSALTQSKMCKGCKNKVAKTRTTPIRVYGKQKIIQIEYKGRIENWPMLTVPGHSWDRAGGGRSSIDSREYTIRMPSRHLF